MTMPGFGRCWILAGCCLAALSGCASRETGYRITDETVAFVQPGATSRSEVIENLGPPLLDLKDIRVMAYSWGKVHAVGGKSIVRDEGMRSRQIDSPTIPAPSSPLDDESGLVEARRWVYCVACDAQDRVRRAERIRLEGPSAPLEQVVRHWAATTP